jgi:peroxiredoxin
VNRVASIFITVSVLILAGAIALAMWQAQARTAAPAPPAIATNAPVVGQGEANIAEVKPVALADIPGNIANGGPAPDFTVRTLGGGQFALADHSDQPTMILFMASWCYSCIYEAQNLAEVHAQYKERGLNIIALDVQEGDTDADLQGFRESAGNPDYVWAFDDSYAVTQAYNVRTLDTTVLIDQAGNIVYYDQRPTPLEPLLQAAMAVLP